MRTSWRPRSTTGIGNVWPCWRWARSLRQSCASPREATRRARAIAPRRSRCWTASRSGTLTSTRSASWIASGTYVLDVDPSQPSGVSAPQYDFFQQAMLGREFISGVTISGVTNQPALYHSVPIRNAAGEVVGVLRARSSLVTVTQIVHAAAGRLGANADGVLLDANGLVIANTIDEGWLLRPTVTLGGGSRGDAAQGFGVGARTAPPRLRWPTPSWRAPSASNSRPCSIGH